MVITPPTAEQLRRAESDSVLLQNVRSQILQMTQEQRAVLLMKYEDLKTTERLHQLGRTKFSLDNLRWVSTVPKASNSTRSSTKPSPLSGHREISSIPRALPTNHDRQNLNRAEAAASTPTPVANSERDTGHDRETGNWIYPSQEMFFAAMKRKGHEANAADMSTIVPIHNAVNERAWSHILDWERGRGSEKCGGPKLISFSGDSKALTPRARWKGWMGYQQPFDRHDWVVDRCGRRVEYVIDFYEGKGLKQGEGQQGGGRALAGKNLNFYLDVRPKINNWEGISTRVASAMGM